MLEVYTQCMISASSHYTQRVFMRDSDCEYNRTVSKTKPVSKQTPIKLQAETQNRI